MSDEEVERLRTLVGYVPDRDADKRKRRGWELKKEKPPETEEQ